MNQLQPFYRRPWTLVAGLALFLVGCASPPPPPTVAAVDLDRFMGDWYVIGGIFTPLEKGAHNAVETYERGEDGRIETTFTFRKGGFDGPEKVYRPTGFIHDEETNAEWRMQFVWPFKAAYLILYLDDAYAHTAIGVPSRRYLWIMARTPDVDEDVYQGIVDQMVAVGYQTNDMVRVPHRWP